MSTVTIHVAILYNSWFILVTILHITSCRASLAPACCAAAGAMLNPLLSFSGNAQPLQLEITWLSLCFNFQPQPPQASLLQPAPPQRPASAAAAARATPTLCYVLSSLAKGSENIVDVQDDVPLIIDNNSLGPRTAVGHWHAFVFLGWLELGVLGIEHCTAMPSPSLV